MSRHANVPFFVESLFTRLSLQISRQLVRALSVQPPAEPSSTPEAMARLFSAMLDEEPEPASWPMWLKAAGRQQGEADYQLASNIPVSGKGLGCVELPFSPAIPPPPAHTPFTPLSPLRR